MLSAGKVAFCFCIVISAFEETVSWTIDLPQVRKYFFEKSLNDRAKHDSRVNDKVFYDNINTHSLHTDYDKYREHYADEYKYHGYMEQKVHDAVRNGSAYLEGLRRAIEAYTNRLESCRRQPVTANIIQFRPNILNLTDVSPSNVTGVLINLSSGNLTNLPGDPSNLPGLLTNLASGNLSLGNLNLPTNFSGPPDNAFVAIMNTNFTEFVSRFSNYTMVNMSDGLADCVRADMASEHVRRLAQLAVWAASELQDKLYEEKYSEHHHGSKSNHGYQSGNKDVYGHQNDYRYGNGYQHGDTSGYGHGSGDDYQHGGRDGHEHDPGHDDTLVLRLAWFLDRLAHLTGYDPKPEQFVQQDRVPSPPPPQLPLTMMATVISPEDMRRMTSCLREGGAGGAPERCAWAGRMGQPADNTRYRGWPSLSTPPPDLRPSASENQEYTYSEQDFSDDDMPLSLPQRTKAKRSVPEDPLQNLVQYYAKYKTWTGSNQDLHPSESQKSDSHNPDSNLIRPKRFIVKKKSKHLLPENPFQDLSSIVKHKSDLHIKKDEKEAKAMKEFMKKLHIKRPKTVSQNAGSNLIRSKRFIVKKKLKHLKPEIPFPDLGSIVKHKLEVHMKKNEKEAKSFKKFLEKLHITRPKTEVKVLKFKKQKRSVKYSKKVQPRIPVNPQGDISYYVKNKPGRSYSYNPAQAAAVRAGLEQAFQTGNLLVVQRYGSNYNPANRMQIAAGYAEGFSDV